MQAGKNPKEEFRASRIPGSRFFDMDRVSDPSTDLPHMLPSEGAFAAAADALDITRDTQVRAHAHACAASPACPLKTMNMSYPHPAIVWLQIQGFSSTCKGLRLLFWLLQVVVYDRSGVFSAPRVWWTFRAFGHDR